MDRHRHFAHGLPGDGEAAAGRLWHSRGRGVVEDRSRFCGEFENWAVIALGGIPNKTQVGDKGIDGRIFPVGVAPREAGADELQLQDRWYPIQVKQKDKVGRPDIDAFETAMRRAKREKGFFVAFDYSEDALREIDRHFREDHVVISPLTVQEILDEQIARKLL
jgi:hypothetical protein